MSKKSFHDIMNANSAFQNHIEVGIHNFLHSRYFVIPISILIFVDLITVIMQTFSSMQLYSAVFNLISLISACVFTAEYVARLYSAPAEMPLLNTLHARIKYAFSFLGLIDLICIAPFVFSYLYRTHMIKEFVDIARILLIFKFLHYTNSYTMIRDVIKSVRYEMLTAMSMSSLIVCFSAILMYYIERNAQPNVFTNVGEGFWWAIITFTTVGYGDVVPITPLGKILACVVAFVGIITLMLPTGIISGALMSRIQEEHKKNQQQNDADAEATGNDKSTQSLQSVPSEAKSPDNAAEAHVAVSDANDLKRCPHCGKEIK